MKKSIAAILALSIYGCGAAAPVVANMDEMFWFPEKSGVIKEFTDENARMNLLCPFHVICNTHRNVTIALGLFSIVIIG